jgi:hypothetical protein
MRVGIDLDGVCYDFAGSLRKYLVSRSLRQPHECPDAQRWEFYEDWGITLDQFLDHCHAAVDAGIVFKTGTPYSGTREAFQAIKSAGHSIHIVTDRTFGKPGASAAATLGWLARHGLEFDSITFSADKTVAQLDVMVDDKPSNYAALEAAGVEAYLLTRPWNQHVENARRVLDLLHFAEVIA